MNQPSSFLQRSLVLAYGLAAYAVALLVLAYTVGFLGNFLVPKSIDSPASMPFSLALLIDVGLLVLFAVQHSVMARPAFKRWWTRLVPKATERSTYLPFSCLALGLVFAFWQPLGGKVWEVSNPAGRAALYGAFALGWLLLNASAYLINHFDLFGLRQVWLYFRGRPYTALPFKTPSLYKIVRHPLYVGWFFIFWATPTMTGTHLVFALLTTVYILLAIRWEERDLMAYHPEYADYRRRVPMLVPMPSGNRPA